MCATCRGCGGQRRLVNAIAIRTCARRPSSQSPVKTSVVLNIGTLAFWHSGETVFNLIGRATHNNSLQPQFPAPQRPTADVFHRRKKSGSGGFIQSSLLFAGNYASFGSGAALARLGNSHIPPANNQQDKTDEGGTTDWRCVLRVCDRAGRVPTPFVFATLRRYPMTNRWNVARPSSRETPNHALRRAPVRRGR